MEQERRIRRGWLAAAVVGVVVVLACIGGAWAAGAGAGEDSLAALARRERDLRQSVAALATKQQEQVGKIAAMAVRETDLRIGIAAAEHENKDLVGKIEHARTEMADLRAKNAKLAEEHRTLGDQVVAAKAEADEAVCRATWERYVAAGWEVYAEDVQRRATYAECAARVAKSNGEQTGLGCLLGIALGGIGGGVMCGGAMALEQSVEATCGAAPLPLTQQQIEAGARQRVGVQAGREPACFARHGA